MFTFPLSRRSLRPAISAAVLISPLIAAPDTVDTTFTTNAGNYYDKTDFGGVASVLVPARWKDSRGLQ